RANAAPAIVARRVEGIGKSLSGFRYEVALEFRDQFPCCGRPAKVRQLTTGAVNSDEPPVAPFESCSGIAFRVGTILDVIQQVDVFEKSFARDESEKRLELRWAWLQVEL